MKKVRAMMMLNTLTARCRALPPAGRIMIQNELYSPRSRISRKVGIRPPEKNMVKVRYSMIALRPGRSRRDSA